MKISTFSLSLVFVFFTLSLQAQKTSDSSSPAVENKEASVSSILSITPDQMEALKQLEAELQEKEARKKTNQINYKSDLTSLLAEREAKIKNILNSEQWKRYEAMHKATEGANEKRKDANLNKGQQLQTKPQLID